jgi:hypothetical protein
MTFVLENLRLRDLVAIVRQNQAFYTEFVAFLKGEGYKDIHSFMNERTNKRALQVLDKYLASTSEARLYDGLGRPYKDTLAKWYFLAWILRDAPAQRLAPLLQSIDGDSLDKKKSFLLNEIRKFVGPLFPEANKWEWPVLSEVMLARLEGSRRALKGSRFEEIVRNQIRTLFKAQKIALTVGDREIRINEETYDVQVLNGKDTILLPVKTRETMGGGHANLFTRDIFKSISVAHDGGYQCIPVIIAESWAGNLASLKCEHLIYLKTNPNQTEEVQKMLAGELAQLLPVWRKFEGGKS